MIVYTTLECCLLRAGRQGGEGDVGDRRWGSGWEGAYRRGIKFKGKGLGARGEKRQLPYVYSGSTLSIIYGIIFSLKVWWYDSIVIW